MKKKLLILLLIVGTQHCSHQNNDQIKRNVLNAVSTIKPIQQIILDYLDIPDHLVQTFTGLGQRYKLIAFSEQDIALAATKYERDEEVEPIQLRNLITGKLVSTIPHDLKQMRSLSLSPNSKYIAITASHNKHGYIFDTLTRQTIINFDRFSSVTNFSPNSNYFAHAYTQNNPVNTAKIQLWDLNTRKLIDVFTLHYQPNNQATQLTPIFSPDNTHIACTSTEKSIALIDILTKEIDYLNIQGHDENSGWIEDISFSVNGKFLICQYASIIELVEIAKKSVAGCSYRKFTFDPRGKYVITHQRPSMLAYNPEQNIFNVPILYLEYLSRYQNEKLFTAKIQFIKNGAYLIAHFGGDNSEVAVYQNQTLDPNCQPPIITDISKELEENTSKKTACVIS